jgi:hypothetical protein
MLPFAEEMVLVADHLELSRSRGIDLPRKRRSSEPTKRRHYILLFYSLNCAIHFMFSEGF